MIAADQATIFPKQFFVATSSLANGVIRYPSLDPASPANLRKWCQEIDVPLAQTVGLYITYSDDRTYTDIATVNATLDAQGAAIEKGWLAADALVTTVPGIALVLPVADCNAVVYVDPVNNVMALAHLGWHATVRNLAVKVVHHMAKHYGTKPEDILIYNSPSIRVHSYRFAHLEQTPDTLWHTAPYATEQSNGTYFIDLVKYNYDQWVSSGVDPKHIQIVDVDTATSDNYPSHFMGQNSRFIVFAQITQ